MLSLPTKVSPPASEPDAPAHLNRCICLYYWSDLQLEAGSAALESLEEDGRSSKASPAGEANRGS